MVKEKELKCAEYPLLETYEGGINLKGPCLVTCPTCGYQRRRWHKAGKAWFLPPDRKPTRTNVNYCEKCGTIIFIDGIFGSPWVSPERVRDPNDLSVKKFPKKLREFMPDDRGW